MRGGVTDAGRTTNKQTVKIELLSQWKLEAEFRNIQTKLEKRWFLRGHHRSVPALTNQPQLHENATKNSEKWWYDMMIWWYDDMMIWWHMTHDNILLNISNLYAEADARSMTPSRNTRSFTIRSVPSSPGRSFLAPQSSAHWRGAYRDFHPIQPIHPLIAFEI